MSKSRTNKGVPFPVSSVMNVTTSSMATNSTVWYCGRATRMSVRWGRPVRLRFELKDADLYALRFSE